MTTAPNSYGVAPDDDGLLYLTAKFFRDSGLLWKINHDILHPLGLALGVGLQNAADPGDTIAAVFRIYTASDGVWTFSPEDNERKSNDWAAFAMLVQDGLIDLTPPTGDTPT